MNWTYLRDGDYWQVGPFEGKDNHEMEDWLFHLISAAPNLLAACEEALVRLEELAEHGLSSPLAKGQLADAIAKAKGTLCKG